uniref:HD-GYP domain-containing protein n=1 Tax=Fundidesulfovibrio putealis TaxID=270496 RepID=A0A7C4AHE1_9BACT
MIVKCATAQLKPGMYIANPGLSQSGNPHIYLAEGLVSRAEDAEKIAEAFFDTYIDTEKGTYFIDNKDEKAAFESLFNALVFSGEENKNGSGRGGLDDMLTNFKAAENRYAALLASYREIAQKMMLVKNVDMDASQRLAESIVATEDNLLLALLLVSRMRQYDAYSYTHSLNVSILAAAVGRSLGFSECSQVVLGMAGMFHDVGKILIPDKILKKPGKLSRAEYAEIKRHPAYGREILQRQKNVPADVVGAAHEHHEHVDGGGYPQGLSGNAINPTSSLISILDTFDALRSDRYHREAINSHKAMCVVYSLKGKAFVPDLVDKVVKMAGIFPVGSIVVLKDGTKAIVTEQNPQNLLRPRVRIILDRSNRYCPVQDVDLMLQDPEGPYAIVDTLSNKECRVHVHALVERVQA